jgi:hypothetical protein
MPAWIFFSDASDIGYDDWRKKYNNIVSFELGVVNDKDVGSFFFFSTPPLLSRYLKTFTYSPSSRGRTTAS